MIKIEEYILRPLKERQAHLKLDEPCVERGGQSYHLKGLLAYLLNTTIPSGRNLIMICHACYNSRCNNPNHVYWGTSKENRADSIACGSNSKSLWQKTVDKHGEAKAREILRQNSIRANAVRSGM